jgi:hypothetical protein
MAALWPWREERVQEKKRSVTHQPTEKVNLDRDQDQLGGRSGTFFFVITSQAKKRAFCSFFLRTWLCVTGL